MSRPTPSIRGLSVAFSLSVIAVLLVTPQALGYGTFSLTATTGPSKGEITIVPNVSPITDFQGAVVVRSRSPITWSPKSGEIFPLHHRGEEVADGVVLAVNYGAAMSTYFDAGLEPGVTYYYKG